MKKIVSCKELSRNVTVEEFLKLNKKLPNGISFRMIDKKEITRTENKDDNNLSTMREIGLEKLPPVILLKDEESYIMLDGHHRLAIANEQETKEMLALVIKDPNYIKIGHFEWHFTIHALKKLIETINKEEEVIIEKAEEISLDPRSTYIKHDRRWIKIQVIGESDPIKELENLKRWCEKAAIKATNYKKQNEQGLAKQNSSEFKVLLRTIGIEQVKEMADRKKLFPQKVFNTVIVGELELKAREKESRDEYYHRINES